MLKPLIRTIPNLSGNVKIACSLSNFSQVDDIFECYVRYAKLLPISNVLVQKQCEVNLLNSTYEFDLKSYYKMYSSIFYDSQFTYSKNVYADADFHDLKNRDKDFEFGVKRVSVIKNNGAQFAFFAPIWMDSINDIPDYFLLHINIGKYAIGTKKTIKIKINDKEKTDKLNYLSIYLNKYAKNLNTNVVFCTPLTNQATYYGIDLVRGGFVKKIDNIIGKNYRFQSSINKFDLNITEGFRRNKMCIKQIVPLCFMFSLEDILTKYEISKYGGAKINITGEYWKDNIQIGMYDFSTDYTSLNQKSWLMKNGKFKITDTKRNIMNMEFPSLMEASYHGYEHFNKIQKEAVRWKLKYSDDGYPYITNMSPAFSMAQQSMFKYREYPAPFTPISVYDDINNNIISPLRNIEYYEKDNRALVKYETIMQNNASNWFNVIDNIETYVKRIVYNYNDFKSNTDWYKNVTENIIEYIPISYNGNLSNVEEEYFNREIPIDNEFTGTLYRKISDSEREAFENKFNPSEDNEEYVENFECILYEKQNIFENKDNWSNVIGNKVYFKGILYDLSEIYNKYPTLSKIDKFGVFVKPNLQRIEQDKLNEIKTAHFSIMSDKKYARHLNAVQSTHLKGLLSGNEKHSTIYMSESSIGRRMNEVTHDSLFFENKSQSDGQFLDLTQIGYDVYDLNRYYEYKEIKKNFPDAISILEAKRNKEIINGYYQIPIYRLSQASYDHDTLWFENNKNENNLWIRENLSFNLRGNHNKSKYDKKAFKNIINKYYSWILECPLLIETEFVSLYTLKQLTNITENNLVGLTPYMFNPILVDQNEVYSLNVFTEIKTLDKNYGDYLPETRKDEDLDFIYVDPYNMKNVMGNNWGSTWLNDDTDEQKNLYSHEFYAKFLNQIHLKIFIGELYKNEENNGQDVNKLNMLFIKRRLLVNDYENEKLQLKDLYINILDFYKNDYEYPDSDDNKKDIIRRLLNDLIYDEDTQTWHFSEEFANLHNVRSLLMYTDDDPLLSEYNFELTFKKRFLKVNSKIWNKININNFDQFTDLYLYRISREDDYPEALKYQFVDKGIFDDNDLNDSHLTLQPLFTSVFIKNQKVSTIYIEYNQSKVSYATYGTEKFYRYDSDNTPLMIDISSIDITHNLVYGPNNVAYYSYSYLQNLMDGYDPEETDSLQYAYANKLTPFFDNGIETFNHLPTFDIIDNCEANVVLAHGSEPVLEYYSTMSYNYVGHNVGNTTSYYSQVEYDRINLNNYLDVLHLELGEHKQTNDIPPIHYYNSTYYTDDVMTYYDIHRQYTTRNFDYDDLGIYDEFGISTYITTYSYNSYYSYVAPTIEKMKTDDGLIVYDATVYKTVSGYTTHTGYCTYGLIYIDAKFDNTNSSLNIIDKYHNDKKYFTQVNGRNIYDSTFTMQSDFNQFVPFMKFDLFSTLTSHNNFVVKPYTITINAYNYPTPLGGRKAYDIVSSNRPIANITLERYFDSITPLITEVYNVPNTYMVKLENREKHTFIKSEKDESVLYNENVNINNTNGVRVYSNKHDYERVFQIEEKHFNDNYTINLEHKISILVGKNLTYQEVIEAEIYENVLKLFANYIRKNGDFDDNEILFLFNKYDVSYDSYSTGIDYDRICKVYSLTIIFNLL